MATNTYISYANLNRFGTGFANKVKAGFVAKAEGKGLSTNDLTNELKAQYDAAQANVIEVIKVNGTALDITEKGVNIVVPSAAIEKIKVDGTEVTPDSNKVVNISLSGKVDKVEGKDLSSNDFTDDLKTALETLNGTATTEGSVKKQIADAVGGITSFEFKVVSSTAEVTEKGYIYLVPKNPAQTNNSYNEYIYTGTAIERIGDTEIDLSGYMKTEDYAVATDDEIDTIINGAFA